MMMALILSLKLKTKINNKFKIKKLWQLQEEII